MVILPKSVWAWCLFIERNANFMTWQLFINYPDVLAFLLKTSVDFDNISDVSLGRRRLSSSLSSS